MVPPDPTFSSSSSGSSGQEPTGEATVRIAESRRQAEEWALVLSAEGLSPTIRYRQDRFSVCVPSQQQSESLTVLLAYDEENAAAPTLATPRPEPFSGADRLTAAVSSLAMIAFFSVTGPRRTGISWFDHGAADAAAILSGELWRSVTALTLHADLTHVASNALFGALFLTAISAGFGPGVALLLTVLSGATGNLANAVFQGPGHASVGASTAVFGGVGLLAGRAAARHLRRGSPRFRPWVPIAAGLALLAMLGTTGQRTDIWAHLFGFAAGGFYGIPAALAWTRPANFLTQLGAALTAVAIVGYAWHRALA